MEKKFKLNAAMINKNRAFLLLAIVLFCGLFVDNFYTAYNIRAVTGNGSLVIWLGLGFTIVLIAGHPAKRTFQAIRIELNRELDVLRDSLDGMIDLLDDGGRICIITFHSLEDRIVKTIFRKNENPCTCPPDFPVCVCGKKSKGKVITRKPILPGKEEMEENPRSKSAKLRIFERKM